MSFAQVALTDQSGRTLVAQAADHPTGTGDFVRDVPGWYDGVGSDVETLDRITAGVMVASSRLAARVFSVVGYSVRDTDTEAAEVARHLAALFSDGGAADGQIEAVHDGRTLTCFAQRTGAPTVTLIRPRKRVEWTIPFVAADPHLYGPPQSVSVGQQGVGVGLRYPFFAASDGGVLHFGTAVEQSAVLTNTGNAIAYPTYVIVGDLPSGFVISQGAGLVRFDGSCTADAPVTVDMSGSVSVGGQDRTWLCGETRWAGIDPGASITPTFSAPQGSGFCEATVYPTWL